MKSLLNTSLGCAGIIIFGVMLFALLCAPSVGWYFNAVAAVIGACMSARLVYIGIGV